MLSLFALHKSNRFVHVSEVERGLACDCRCAVCGEIVVARQGELREHHFAHSSNAAPCASSYESDLHRFAKRVIVEAGGLVVPAITAVAKALGLESRLDPSLFLKCTSIEEEVSVGDRRPDLLAEIPAGVKVAIEVAYSSFCDAAKRQDYAQLQLPALEIDLRAFTPENFDVAQVKSALLEETDRKTWLWPERVQPDAPISVDDESACTEAAPVRHFPPEEIVTFEGRWISVKELPSGDIAIKAVRYDPEVVSVVRTVARTHHGRYQDRYHSWVIPRFRANAARAQLRAIASSTHP